MRKHRESVDLLLLGLSSPLGGAVVKLLMWFLVLCWFKIIFGPAVTNAPYCAFP